MRKILFFVAVPLLIVLVTSCRKDNMEYKNSFERSYNAWLIFKKTTGDNYRYKVHSGSWTGAYSETIITVKAGEVVGREYKAGNLDRETNEPVVLNEWTENETDINSHDAGARAITLDEVYHKAKTDWLKKRDNADTYFEAKNQGMISSCGYVEKGCQDDCFIGISISYIQEI